MSGRGREDRSERRRRKGGDNDRPRHRDRGERGDREDALASDANPIQGPVVLLKRPGGPAATVSGSSQNSNPSGVSSQSLSSIRDKEQSLAKVGSQSQSSMGSDQQPCKPVLLQRSTNLNKKMGAVGSNVDVRGTSSAQSETSLLEVRKILTIR
jgi:hypothetical protein